MTHAFLIIAHGKWEQLKLLIKQLDDKDVDIFIHIDKKVKNPPIEELCSCAKISKVKIYQEYKVYWGSFELVETELLLLKKAKKYNYDYYHLLSGMDLMIKPMSKMKEFFENNKGFEFVHYDTEERLIKDKEIQRRTKLFHYFTNYRRRFKCKLINSLFTFLDRISMIIQMAIGIDRNKKYKEIIKYGSQWFSITDTFAKYVIDNKDKVYRIFKYTKCSDELFIQTLLFNSNFKNKLYDKKFDNDCMANVRLIDISIRGKNGSPYTWKINDLDELTKTECLFARKFDMNIDKEIVEKIIELTK